MEQIVKYQVDDVGVARANTGSHTVEVRPYDGGAAYRFEIHGLLTGAEFSFAPNIDDAFRRAAARIADDNPDFDIRFEAEQPAENKAA